MDRFDTAIIGGGIVGLATAMALAGRGGTGLVVLEAEDRPAVHQSGRNSGVIHAGLYYRPGSLKARLCAEGREALYEFCRTRSIPHERCGKVVVAAGDHELERLAALEERGRANGLEGLRRITRAELAEIEPHAGGVAALAVPQTGVVDFGAVTRAFADVVREAGGVVRTGARVRRAERRGGGYLLHTAAGAVACRALVTCAGLHADRVARMCGAKPGVRLVPFRGCYRRLDPAREHLVRGLIYPVPDPRLPFLGVHATRRIGADGRRWVEVGPGAVLALARHGYRWADVRLDDLAETLAWAGFWRMAARWGPTAVREVRQALSRRTVAAALRPMLPEIRHEDLLPAPSGVRAQAIDRRGALLDDFHIVAGEHAVHVVNAPSPAATASIAIGRLVAARLTRSRRG